MLLPGVHRAGRGWRLEGLRGMGRVPRWYRSGRASVPHHRLGPRLTRLSPSDHPWSDLRTSTERQRTPRGVGGFYFSLEGSFHGKEGLRGLGPHRGRSSGTGPPSSCAWSSRRVRVGRPPAVEGPSRGWSGRRAGRLGADYGPG